jgi:hypothetical protein
MKEIMDELTKIQKNLQRMPREIIKLILFYSHSFQPNYLLEDIKNVNIVKKKLMVMYRHYWEDEDMDWLINDIISYLNDYWPDTSKIEQSGQYNEKEYARYLLPKISEAFRKSLEKIFNKSNNYSEILAIKEKIYVKDLSK